MCELAESFGGKCLATEYTRSDASYEFVCANDHKFSILWKTLKKNHKWCKKCPKVKIEVLRVEAARRGGRCLSEKYKIVNTKYRWECSEGHRWVATWGNVNGNKTWCPDCRYVTVDIINEKLTENQSGRCVRRCDDGRFEFECEEKHRWVTQHGNVYNGSWCIQCLKLSLNHAREEAVKRNGKCLETEYVNKRKLMEWECENGHRFRLRLGAVRNNGRWCRKCFHDGMRHDIAVAHEEAVKRNGKCLSTDYVNVGKHLLWECARGHRWEAGLGGIMNGNWCNMCVMRRRRVKCINRIFKRIKMLGGVPITKKEDIPYHIISESVDIKCRCDKGYIFTRSLKSLQNGSWCPKCRFKSEEKCRDIFEDIYGYDFVKKRLKCMEGLELDGYCEDLGIAFEYDGLQHVKFIPHFHRTEQGFKEQQRRDRRKDQLAANNAITLIRIPSKYTYNEPEALREYIGVQLKRIEQCDS